MFQYFSIITYRIRTNEKVLLKSISIPKAIFAQCGSIDYYCYHLIKVDITATVQDEPASILNHARNEDVDFIRIFLNPPYQIDAEVKLTVSLSRQIKYQVRANQFQSRYSSNEMHTRHVDGYVKIVSNYGDFVDTPCTTEFGVEIEIKRRDEDNLPLNYGFLEKLEFEVV